MLSNRQPTEVIAKLDVVGTYFPFYISSHVHRATTVHKFYTKRYAEFVEHYNKIPTQSTKYLVFLDLFHYMPNILQNVGDKLPINIWQEFDIFYDIHVLNKLIYDNTNILHIRDYSYANSKRPVYIREDKKLAQQSRLIARVIPPGASLSTIIAAVNQRANQIFTKIVNIKYNSFVILFIAALYNVNLISGEVNQATVYTNLYFIRTNLILQCLAYANNVLYSNAVNAIFAYNIVDGIKIITPMYYYLSPHTLYSLLMINYTSSATTGRLPEQVSEFMRCLLDKISPDAYNYDVSLFISTILIYKNSHFQMYYDSLEYYMTKTKDVNTYTVEQHRDDFGGYSYTPTIPPAEHFDTKFPNCIYYPSEAKLVLAPFGGKIQDLFPYIVNPHIRAQMFIKFLQTVNNNPTSGDLSGAPIKIPGDIQEDVLLLLYPELILNLRQSRPVFVHANFVLLLISLLYRSYNIYNADIQQHKLYVDKTDLQADLGATISFSKLNAYLADSDQTHYKLFETFNTIIEFLIQTQPMVYTKNYILTSVKSHFTYLVATRYFNFMIDRYVPY